MELLIIVIYAGILALVAPFILGRSNNYGSLVPFGLAAVSGATLFLLFTWLGFSYEAAWIWFLVMLGMPAAVWFGLKLIESKRTAEDDAELERIRSGKLA
jgi:Ca2+/Na+ antiporter